MLLMTGEKALKSKEKGIITQMDKTKILRQIDEEQQEMFSQAQPGHSVTLSNPDLEKWEMDTSELLDRVRHDLLGYSKDVKGNWVEDPTKEKVMNEFGVSRFIVELQSRININMQMSELTKDEIHGIVADAGETYSTLLQDNFERWGIRKDNIGSELDSIATMFTHNLFILLHIAMNAGMRKHREHRGIKTYSPPVPQGMY